MPSLGYPLRGHAGVASRTFLLSVVVLAIIAVACIVLTIVAVALVMSHLESDKESSTTAGPTELPVVRTGRDVHSVVLTHQQTTLLFEPGSGRLEVQGARRPLAGRLGWSVGQVEDVIVSQEAHRFHVAYPALKTKLSVAINSHYTDHLVTVFDVTWSNGQLYELLDSFALGTGYWYGGAEVANCRWPINAMQLKMLPFVTNDQNQNQYGSVQERYWLSSDKIAITVDAADPLWVSWNENGSAQLVFMAKYKDSIYANFVEDLTTAYPALHYRIWVGHSTLKDLHLSIVQKLLGFPTDHPDEKMLRYPIFTTWANYHKDVNQTRVIEFAKAIQANGFKISHLAIDDAWASHYGDFDWDLSKFPDIPTMIAQLKDMGYRTTVWIHPFANVESKFGANPTSAYWVKQPDGRLAYSSWWDGVGLSLDTTSAAATDWYVSVMDDFRRRSGVDSFKFDAGETNWLPSCFKLAGATYPNQYSQGYARMAYRMGSLIEVRVGAQTQTLPVFVRILDKDSKWGLDNGLKSLLTSALTFSILGYPYILPDMVGGNAYIGLYPSKELYIRWVQATTFMPSMEFSIAPWNYNDTAFLDTVLHYAKLHSAYDWMTVVKELETTGQPLLRPVWWLDESDDAFQVEDEFLVGGDLLVAPVMDEGSTHRRVYLPPGRWQSQMRGPAGGQTFEGPSWIDQDVPLEELAYYKRV